MHLISLLILNLLLKVHLVMVYRPLTPFLVHISSSLNTIIVSVLRGVRGRVERTHIVFLGPRYFLMPIANFQLPPARLYPRKTIPNNLMRVSRVQPKTTNDKMPKQKFQPKKPKIQQQQNKFEKKSKKFSRSSVQYNSYIIIS